LHSGRDIARAINRTDIGVSALNVANAEHDSQVGDETIMRLNRTSPDGGPEPIMNDDPNHFSNQPGGDDEFFSE
jgi:hypothetical protein